MDTQELIEESCKADAEDEDRVALLGEAKEEYLKQKEANDSHQCTSRCNDDIDCYYEEEFMSFEDWLLEQ